MYELLKTNKQSNDLAKNKDGTQIKKIFVLVNR